MLVKKVNANLFLNFCVSFIKFGDLIALSISHTDRVHSMLVAMRHQCTPVFMPRWFQLSVEKQTYLDSSEGGCSPAGRAQLLFFHSHALVLL